MLANEVLKIDTSLEVAVIDPSQVNRGRNETGIESVKPRRVRYGMRVNGLRYATKSKTGRSWSENLNDFTVTSERVFGYLVKFVLTNGNESYAVVKPTNFIATKSEYQTYWNVREAQEKAEQEAKEKAIELQAQAEARRNAIRTERMAQHLPEAERIAESIRESIYTLLGMGVRIRSTVRADVGGVWENENTPQETYRVQQMGSVTMEMRDFQRLLELAIQE